MNEPKLGDLAKDKIIGFTGVVVAETKWLNGCRRVTIQPNKLDKDGNIREPETFDTPQVVVVESAPLDASEPAGGPKPSPTRNADPK